jgi:hypothetical protein
MGVCWRCRRKERNRKASEVISNIIISEVINHEIQIMSESFLQSGIQSY